MEIKEFMYKMNRDYYRNGAYHGIKNPAENSTSGNHHVINATYYSIIDRFNEVTGSDQKIASDYIHACEEKAGIYNRTPDKFDHQSHDDYIGICCTSNKLFLPFAADIVQYGKKHWWYFDNTEETTKFEIKNWHGRFPWALHTYKVCAGGCASLLSILGFCAYMYMGTFNKDLTDTSGRILRWLQKESVKGKNGLVDFFIHKWEADILEKYPNGMGDVFGIYYGEEHPFAQIMKDDV